MKAEDAEQAIKQIDKKIVKASIINAPGSMMFGLGLFGKFAGNAANSYPFLSNPSTVNALLILGAVVMVWGGFQVFTLSKQKSQLKNRYKL